MCYNFIGSELQTKFNRRDSQMVYSGLNRIIIEPTTNVTIHLMWYYDRLICVLQYETRHTATFHLTVAGRPTLASFLSTEQTLRTPWWENLIWLSWPVAEHVPAVGPPQNESRPRRRWITYSSIYLTAAPLVGAALAIGESYRRALTVAARERKLAGSQQLVPDTEG